MTSARDRKVDRSRFWTRSRITLDLDGRSEGRRLVDLRG
jgi:hypothetical protein